MDFEQLFDSFAPGSTSLAGGHLQGDLVSGAQPVVVGQDDAALMAMIMGMQGANEQTTIMMNDNIYNKDQVVGGTGTEKLEDYSAFLNYGQTQDQQFAPIPFDLTTLLSSTASPASNVMTGSGSLSNYTSFSTPALIPGTNRSPLCSDFEDVEQASPSFGNMFPPMAKAPVEQSSDFTFGDFDGSAMFGLPMFGAMNTASRAPPTARLMEPQQTASPKNIFAAIPSPSPRLSGLASPAPPSPLIEFDNASIAPSSGKAKKKKTLPTGTRKSRAPLDPSAPTMTKSYSAPGATTRKLIPAGFQKKLNLSADDVGDAVLPEDMTDKGTVLEEIEVKRRRNCVAARESRRRKVEYQDGLKDEIREWRKWAEEVQKKLKDQGMEELCGEMPSGSMNLEE